MPSPELLHRFIDRVESNSDVQAIEEFCAPPAAMQENEQPPLTATVFPASATGNLMGLSGALEIKIVDGKHFLRSTT